ARRKQSRPAVRTAGAVAARVARAARRTTPPLPTSTEMSGAASRRPSDRKWTPIPRNVSCPATATSCASTIAPSPNKTVARKENDMWTRRQFLGRATGSLCTLAGAGLGLSTRGDDEPHQIRGMITQTTQEAIDAGLAYLAANQNADGSFGTGPYRSNVAITALGGLAFMAGGHQPGRGRYGRNVSRALRNILNNEDRNRPGFLNNPTAAL